MSVDVIIPVYRPGEEFFPLLQALMEQTLQVHKIIIVNTEQSLFESFLAKHPEKSLPENVEVYHVTREAYDHGATRHMASGHVETDYFLCMTQDAVPKDNRLLEHLYAQVTKEGVAVAYARQLATEKSGILEQVSRDFNYPDVSRIKSKEDLETLGIKTYFCSNVCAMYDKSVYNSLGGFVRKTIFNEDMLYAAKATEAGYKIAYVAEACVYHAHNYSNLQQFQRNFDLAVSQADHPEVFAGVKSESEGKKLVSYATKILKEQGKSHMLPYFYMQCASKYAGYLLGKKYKHLPKGLVKKISSNKGYWE